MSDVALQRILQEALYMILLISGPPMVVAMLVGLAISLFQTTTQIQEQTLTFVPKLLAVYLTLALLGSWMTLRLASFAANLFQAYLNVQP